MNLKRRETQSPNLVTVTIPEVFGDAKVEEKGIYEDGERL